MSLNDTTYGWDVSNYQADLTEQHFRNGKNEGIEFSIALATDGTGFQNFMFSRQLDWGRKVGMLTSAYHYVRDASISQQITNIKRTVPLDCPVIPDAEHGSGGINVLDSIVSALLNEGYTVPLEYLPRWYWQIIGSPWLGNRPRKLWASWYPDYVRRNKENGAAMLPSSVWNGYGGQAVAITQFTSSGAAAGYGRALDLNKFRGTRDELAALLGGGDEVGHVDSISGEAAAAIANQIWFYTNPVGYDPVEGKVVTSPYNFNSHIFWIQLYERSEQERASTIEAALAGIKAAVEALANDGDVTADELSRIVNEAADRVARENADKHADLVASRVNGAIGTLVEQALSRVQEADNKAEAVETVTELLKRIGSLVANPAPQLEIAENNVPKEQA